MTIVKSPFRISLFGGSTDYKSFYEKHGSFLIGTPIDKYCYISTRFRPKILSKQYLCTYSIYELVDTINELKNPLIRETLKYFNVDKPIELFSYSDNICSFLPKFAHSMFLFLFIIENAERKL